MGGLGALVYNSLTIIKTPIEEKSCSIPPVGFVRLGKGICEVTYWGGHLLVCEVVPLRLNRSISAIVICTRD